MLLFKFLIVLCIETYPDFVIAGYLAIADENKDIQDPHTKVSLAMAAIGLFITLIAFPILSFWIAFCKRPVELADAKFKQILGVLYEDIKQDSKL